MRFQMVEGNKILRSHHETGCWWRMELILNVIFCLIFYDRLKTELGTYLRILIRYMHYIKKNIEMDDQYSHQLYQFYDMFYFEMVF